MNFTLTQEQYESLIAMARKGIPASDAAAGRRFTEWLKLIEKANGIERDVVTVLWQELDQPLPPGVMFPTTWPPTLKYTVELVTRRVARADIDAVLEERAKNPTSVLCTKDPDGIYGLTPIDAFFIR